MVPNEKTAVVRPDSKGRINVSKFTRPGVSGFSVSQSENGSLVLVPLVEYPAAEVWLWKNPEALASVKRGLEDSAAGRVKPFGSFAQYATETDDE